jgi:hypothetical protein
MRKVILICGLLTFISFTGCASKPPEVVKPPEKIENPVVPGNERMEKMERREVILAVQECEEADMKPFVEYVTQRTQFGKVLVPVNVHCTPTKKVATK